MNDLAAQLMAYEEKLPPVDSLIIQPKQVALLNQWAELKERQEWKLVYRVIQNFCEQLILREHETVFEAQIFIPSVTI